MIPPAEGCRNGGVGFLFMRAKALQMKKKSRIYEIRSKFRLYHRTYSRKNRRNLAFSNRVLFVHKNNGRLIGLRLSFIHLGVSDDDHLVADISKPGGRTVQLNNT